jgi:DNA polymerase
MAWKMGGSDSKIWVPPHLDFPQEVIDHVEAGGIFEAHNVQFERAIWIFILNRQFGIPTPTRWRDTLAVCAYRGLPLKLDAVGKALDLAVKKDERGSYLLNTLSRPKFGTKKEPDRIYREDWELLDEGGATYTGVSSVGARSENKSAWRSVGYASRRESTGIDSGNH